MKKERNRKLYHNNLGMNFEEGARKVLQQECCIEGLGQVGSTTTIYFSLQNIREYDLGDWHIGFFKKSHLYSYIEKEHENHP